MRKYTYVCNLCFRGEKELPPGQRIIGIVPSDLVGRAGQYLEVWPERAEKHICEECIQRINNISGPG